MSFGTTLLWLNSAFFVVYGLAFVFAPEALGRLVTDGAPATPSGMIDMRATYGGMTVAVGVIFGLCAKAPETQPLGLLGVAAVMLFMAAGRTFGIVYDGSPNAMMFVYLAVEIVVMALALVAMRGTADRIGLGSGVVDDRSGA